ISPLTSEEPIDTQAQALSRELNLSDFQNPTKLQAFIERFAANYDSKNGTSESSVETLFNLPTAAANGGGISSTLLLQAQNTNFSILL
ncbi:MAG TPA: hypothetical protein VEK34_11045, partial [Methylocella sp.]|nr:hypothetical protein [Methylocella sp.]